MPSDSTFEQAIDYLRNLDKIRNKISEKLKKGKLKLKDFRSITNWYLEGDAVEKALLIKIFNDSDEIINEVFGKLKEKLTLNNLFDKNLTFTTGENDRVPVLRASTSIEALVLVPKLSYSEEIFNSYYRIIYEFNKQSDIEKEIGGASAGSEQVPRTAFISWCCLKAIIGLSDLYKNSANYLRAISKKDIGITHELKMWNEIDNSRINISASLTHLSLTSKLFNDDDILTCINTININLKSTINNINKEQIINVDSMSKLENIRDILDSINSSTNYIEIANKFDNISNIILSNLEPTTKYLLNVIDHELADDTIHANNRICDAAELTFAADSLRRLNKWDDIFYDAAIKKIIPLITYKGRFPSHKPFDVAKKGYVLHVAGAEVINAFCSLIKQTNYDIDIDSIQKFLIYFEDTWKGDGWRHERSEENDKSARWVTCISITSLESMLNAVNQRINLGVFNHLSVKQPVDIKLNLDDLFYPDYGLSFYKKNGKLNSLAIHLQELRAHILGIRNSDLISQQYSTVLFGPPGTGKTTLVEALAKSANVPLVEITPSDILISGEEKVETRARIVFEALSMLTRCVILFDEFEPILWTREEGGKPNNIYQFLTPGMLPKLKKLHEKAEIQNVAFILSTNIIGGLDEAAIREGRFDTKIGVYPPDLYSRCGRILAELIKEGVQTSSLDSKKLLPILLKTNGLGMNYLGKTFSFIGESGKKLKSCLTDQSYQVSDIKFPNPEKKFNSESTKYYKKIIAEKNSIFKNSKPKFVENYEIIYSPYATQEFEEWKWINEEEIWLNNLNIKEMDINSFLSELEKRINTLNNGK